jgi:uncharacterized protein YdhG (YjbR/CyaY superfamily)
VPKPKTIDEYLDGVPGDRRRALSALRATIHALLPNAEECISYSMPAFRHDGHVVAGFLATSKGCSYFPFSATTLGTLARELGAYDQTKSALHFAPEHPLPKPLVRKLLQARIAETHRRRTARTADEPMRPSRATAEADRTSRAASEPKRARSTSSPTKRAGRTSRSTKRPTEASPRVKKTPPRSKRA